MSENGIISDKLTQKQVRAVALLAIGTTGEQVCDSVKISPRQLARWMKQQPFLAALDESKRRVIQTAFDSMSSIVSKATKAIEESLDSPIPAIRLKAAELTLKFCRETLTIADLDGRLTAVESRYGKV